MKIRCPHSLLLCCLPGLLFLTGCGSNSTVVQPLSAATALGGPPAHYVAGQFSAGKTEIPTHIIEAIKGHLDAELRKRGLAAATDEKNVVRIDSTATYYRMRSGVSRMMFGILAGKDGVECDVQLVNRETGQSVGQLKVSSYNMLAVGGEDDVARMLAEEIAKVIEANRK